MDSGGNGEKSLPGMSFPQWMKKTTEKRYDYTDYTCSSPPSDGFFQLVRPQRPGGQILINETADCAKGQKRLEQLSSTRIETAVAKPGFSKTIADMEKASGLYSSGMAGTKIQLQLHGTGKDFSVAPEPTTNIRKTVSTSSSLTSGVSSSSTTITTNTTIAQPLVSNQVKENPCNGSGKNNTNQGSQIQQVVGDKTMTTTNIPHVIITKPDDGSSLRGFIESKFGNKSVPCTPDVTPSSTPAVTPASSPQMGRRQGGNPFFTPSSTNAPGSVSWLFRPPQADVGYSSDREDSSRDNILYETKVQVNPATNAVKKTFIPRPSKLRELNFWSPTTM